MIPPAIEQLEVQSKRVLVRADLNVPLEGGRIVDDTRIRATLPTIRHLLERSAMVIVMSHLGRPKGKVVSELRLDRVAVRLGELLGQHVEKLDDCMGEQVAGAIGKAAPGSVLMLENLRFHAGEVQNDERFVGKLASLGEAYVNDAFGTCHRAHASVVGMPARLPSAEGLLIAAERRGLDRLLKDPRRPYVAAIGGVKVSDKIMVIRGLLARVDAILLGGAMAYTFLKAAGREIGGSLLDESHLGDVRDLLTRDADQGKKLCLPRDHVVDDPQGGQVRTTEGVDIPGGRRGMDIGPSTIDDYASRIAAAGAFFSNGPMGKFEDRRFAEGTHAVLHAAAQSDAFSVIGGGDSLAAVQQLRLADRIDHMCTGGGASLKYLSGVKLPGLVALAEAGKR